MNAQPFGKYQLLKKLATGGMAEVWLARQSGIEGFEKHMVVKRILPHLAEDPEFVQMFLNEAKIAARFNHPNIAQIYELGEIKGTYFIAMEFIRGEDLGRVMRKAWSTGQWIARPLSIRVVAAACEGLYYAHTKTDEQGRPLRVVHRDISPQNILVSFDGSVKLVDFGIAKAADQASLTKSGAIKGKFAYMSPEQAGGKALDHRSDIFAIGLVLYELLTGVRPLKRDSELATLQAALECNIEPPSKVADVPEELDSVVMKALAKAADDRYRDARVFQTALEEFLAAQRWVAGSVQLSELMETLFPERLKAEAELGRPDPQTQDPSASASVLPPIPPEGSASEWEAPPGQTEMHERAARSRPPARTASRTSNPKREEGSNTLPINREPPPDVPAWSAPSGQATSIARTSSRPDLARVPSRPEVPRSRSSSEVPRSKSQSEISRSKSGSGAEPRSSGRHRVISSADNAVDGRAARSEDDSESTLVPEMLEDVPPPPRRRTSEGSLKATVDAGRRPSKNAPAVRRTPPPVERDEEDAADDSGVQERAAPRKVPTKVIAGGVGALALIAVVAVFHKPIMEALTNREVDGRPILLTVESNLRVRVLVRHDPAEHSAEPVTELGEAPLRRVRGAHVNDTVILKLDSQGVDYEQVIPYGEIGAEQKIVKEFKKGFYQPNLKPTGLRDLSILLNGQEIARYPPATKIELVEGMHTLVIRGEQLKRPAEIEADVKASETTRGKLYDLTPLME